MSAEQKHTPGPLRVVLDGTLTGITAEIHAQDRMIGETETVYVRRDDAYPQNNPAATSWGSFDETPEQYELTEDGAEALANAHLWAAAPELLQYLEIALGVITASKIVWMGADNARAAIAKATGK